ncbi:thioredoxin 2, putative [Plasmodium ovale]|uniref:Thioredoxin 2 n=1 Tax=Plasmodium ovale TaxID=36330 RepID=A0A1C3KV16_PLAOA|nr:thioredoxin 2, putative [Plasmodium ovale]
MHVHRSHGHMRTLYLYMYILIHTFSLFFFFFFTQGVNMKNTIFILYFFAKWCHACKMQGGEMDKLEKYYGKRIYVLKVDIDQNESMARKFAVKSLPTIIIMKNKAVLARKEHFVTSNDLVSLIRKHL